MSYCLLAGFKQNLQTLGQDLDILLKAAGGTDNKNINFASFNMYNFDVIHT